MIRDTSPMQRLLWKDAMTIKPMLIAIVIGIVALNLMLLCFAASFDGFGDGIDGFIMLWILLPNLVALGAPALLVGSEEESGTLGWLRTLPVRWQQIVDSKLIVSLGAVIVSWVVASLLLVVAHAVIQYRVTPLTDDVLSLPGVLRLAFFSLMLLMCGFITVYLVRSPVTALILLIPFICFAYVLAKEIGRWILSGYWGYGGTILYAGPLRWSVMVTLAFATLIAFWLAQRFLARRRLTAPQADRLSRVVSPATEAYRPPARIGLGRPSRVVSLLWQQSRQCGWPGVSLAIIVAGFLILFRLVDSRSWRPNALQVINEFSPLVVGLGASWLGALTFFGDNVRRRCVFFADRGISPTLIWWTRLLLPAFLCIALVSLHFALTLGMELPGDQGFLLGAMIFVMFAFGQLVGQWMPRATLTFFAAPAYSLISIFGLFILFARYPTYALTVLLMVPVLLFATWRLTPRWLDGRIDAGFHCRVVAYTLLAVLLPCLAVFGQRYMSTPAEMSQWRAQMLAADVTDSDETDAHEISPDTYGQRGVDQNLDVEPIREIVKQELASDGMIGAFVSCADLDEVFRHASLDDQLRFDAIAVYLKWASLIREEAANGLQGMYQLDVAENVELRAITQLESMVPILDRKTFPAKKVAELVAMIPSDELRRQSRRITLIREWQNYQRTPWAEQDAAGNITYFKWFANQPLAMGVAGLSLERRRVDRYIDEATRLTLQQFDGRLPGLDSPEYVRRQQLWKEALGPWQQWHPSPWIAGYTWTSDYQDRIDLLRSQAAATNASN